MSASPFTTSATAPTVADLPTDWRARAADLQQWGATEASKALDRAAEQLEEALRRQSDVVLTLGEAARETGYSDEHLGRLVREGKISNAGQKNAPRIRRGDLPHKARRAGLQIAGHGSQRYDPVADARFISSRRGVQ